jgi:hypothetical protein
MKVYGSSALLSSRVLSDSNIKGERQPARKAKGGAGTGERALIASVSTSTCQSRALVTWPCLVDPHVNFYAFAMRKVNRGGSTP